MPRTETRSRRSNDAASAVVQVARVIGQFSTATFRPACILRPVWVPVVLECAICHRSPIDPQESVLNWFGE